MLRVVVVTALFHAAVGVSVARGFAGKFGRKSSWPADVPVPKVAPGPSLAQEVAKHSFTDTARAPSASFVMGEMGQGIGINLGDAYDMPDDYPDRLPFERNKRLIDMYLGQGYKSLRIPVTWGGTFDGNSDFTKELTKTVNYSLSQGLYVCINTHHEQWLKCCYDGSDTYNDPFTALWKNIAQHFSWAGSKLLFEVLNEPEGAFGDWANQNPDPMNQRGIELTRQICNVGLDAIRTVSPTRIVVCAPNAQGNVFQADVVFPGTYVITNYDAYFGITLHTYDPWDFCGQDGNNDYWNVQQMDDTYNQMLAETSAWQQKTGFSLQFGEYGVGRVHEKDRNADIVRSYYQYLTQRIKGYGWCALMWDDGGWYGIVVNWEFVYGLADAAFTPLDGPPPSPTPGGGGNCCWNSCSECTSDSWCNSDAGNCGQCGGEWCGSSPTPTPTPPTPPTRQACCWNSCSECTTDPFCNADEGQCSKCNGEWCSVSLAQVGTIPPAEVGKVPPKKPAKKKHPNLRASSELDISAFLQAPKKKMADVGKAEVGLAEIHPKKKDSRKKQAAIPPVKKKAAKKAKKQPPASSELDISAFDQDFTETNRVGKAETPPKKKKTDVPPKKQKEIPPRKTEKRLRASSELDISAFLQAPKKKKADVPPKKQKEIPPMKKPKKAAKKATKAKTAKKQRAASSELDISAFLQDFTETNRVSRGNVSKDEL